jgi:Methylamine utilisation protein MauE
VIVRIALAGVLAVAVVAKVRDPRAAAAAMATYGFRTPPSRWGALALIVAIESGLAAGVALGADDASYAAAGLMLLLAATQLSAVLAGRSGAPCACFGAGSTVGPLSIARNLVLAVAFTALPSLPGGSLSPDAWPALGLAVAVLACAGLAVAVHAPGR